MFLCCESLSRVLCMMWRGHLCVCMGEVDVHRLLEVVLLLTCGFVDSHQSRRPLNNTSTNLCLRESNVCVYTCMCVCVCTIGLDTYTVRAYVVFDYLTSLLFCCNLNTRTISSLTIPQSRQQDNPSRNNYYVQF